MGLGDPAPHLDSLLGDLSTDQDNEPYRNYRSDPEAESVRSHPSSHAEQALLPHAAPATSSRPQTQRLQRRRYQHYYLTGPLVSVPSTGTETGTGAAEPTPTSTWPHKPAPRPVHGASRGSAPNHHGRAKSHSASGHHTTSSWLLGGGGSPFADAKRQSWTGERREPRKLQKDHPVGSARPATAVAIGDGHHDVDDDGSGSGGGGGSGGCSSSSSPPAVSGGGPADSVPRMGEARGSVLGVRRKMERLRGLYRRTDKVVEVSSGLR